MVGFVCLVFASEANILIGLVIIICKDCVTEASCGKIVVSLIVIICNVLFGACHPYHFLVYEGA